MATSSLLGIDTDNLPSAHNATGIDSLGPSDASDSGSDSAGAYSAESDSDTDRFGTGERGSAEPVQQAVGRDILPDHVESLATDDGTGDIPPLTSDDLPEDTDGVAEDDEGK